MAFVHEVFESAPDDIESRIIDTIGPEIAVGRFESKEVLFIASRFRALIGEKVREDHCRRLLAIAQKTGVSAAMGTSNVFRSQITPDAALDGEFPMANAEPKIKKRTHTPQNTKDMKEMKAMKMENDAFIAGCRFWPEGEQEGHSKEVEGGLCTFSGVRNSAKDV